MIFTYTSMNRLKGPWQSHWSTRKKTMTGSFYNNKATLTTMIQINSPQAESFHPDRGNNHSDAIEIPKSICKQSQLKEALCILYAIDQPDSAAYASLLQACINRKALQEGKSIHAHMRAKRFKPGTFLETKLVILYAKCGALADARDVFDKMPERNVVSWTAMIGACSRFGFDEEALNLIHLMQEEGVRVDQFALATVLAALANLAALEHGREVHEDVIRRGFTSDVFVGSALVDMYVKCGNVEDAVKVFDKMPERDVVSWNAMIAGYVLNGDLDKAMGLFVRMPERNVVSWNAMITGYAQNGLVKEAWDLFQKMPERHVISWNAMIAGCAQNGLVDQAVELFRTMPERNVISWTTMVAGYAQNGKYVEALDLFGEMQWRGVKPNSVTYVSVLPACANLAALEHGKEVHGDITRSGLHFDVAVGNALIDMYAKCGSIGNAKKIFGKMPERNVISWSTMIVGYAMHGYGKDALQLFEHMQQSGTSPNHVTIVGVLSACCHAGLVDDGWHHFHQMDRNYGIIPRAEHYCCMVDLLGRAGQLDEALDFINRMPIKSDAAVWGSLLGACRVHGNIKLGEYVAERLFECDTKNAAHYVILSNIYATVGRWDDAEKVRVLMKERNVNKIPGCSWIEINNKVYSFIVGDRSHPQTPKIYAELQRLYGLMKETGYAPDTNFVLHDVEEEQKEYLICYHSEKLAIAFGIINTAPGVPIRVVKNLRVCGDCHSVTKYISKIAMREIIVRDANRFHHFKDGLCSCRDYW